jgi:hypothetical protein
MENGRDRNRYIPRQAFPPPLQPDPTLPQYVVNTTLRLPSVGVDYFHRQLPREELKGRGESMVVDKRLMATSRSIAMPYDDINTLTRFVKWKVLEWKME